MRHLLKATSLAGVTILLVLAAQATAASSTATSSVYTVDSQTVPGVDTGLVLKRGRSVTVTATGTVCPGTGYCTSPDGVSSVDTTDTTFGGFVLPDAPAYGLVARVGSGPWVQVGSGPTQLTGTGDLLFAFNDDLFVDNVGTFTVTVSYSRASASQVSAPCNPGWGYGDTNHEHTGPPGQGEDACYPGHGYGDKNHEHNGPPGQAGGNEHNGPQGQAGGNERGKPSR